METFRIASAMYALATIAAVTAIPSQAQPAQTVQAALSKEAGTLSRIHGIGSSDDREIRLEAWSGRAFGRRSIQPHCHGERHTRRNADRCNGRREDGADYRPQKLQEALKTSYANLQQTIAGLSDADLKAPVKLFGRDMTKEGAIRFLFANQHEHLGQSIAYARTNGVVPPWSK